MRDRKHHKTSPARRRAALAAAICLLGATAVSAGDPIVRLLSPLPPLPLAPANLADANPFCDVVGQVSNLTSAPIQLVAGEMADGLEPPANFADESAIVVDRRDDEDQPLATADHDAPQVTLLPVIAEARPLMIQPGQRAAVPVSLTNKSDRAAGRPEADDDSTAESFSFSLSDQSDEPTNSADVGSDDVVSMSLSDDAEEFPAAIEEAVAPNLAATAQDNNSADSDPARSPAGEPETFRFSDAAGADADATVVKQHAQPLVTEAPATPAANLRRPTAQAIPVPAVDASKPTDRVVAKPGPTVPVASTAKANTSRELVARPDEFAVRHDSAQDEQSQLAARQGMATSVPTPVAVVAAPTSFRGSAQPTPGSFVRPALTPVLGPLASPSGKAQERSRVIRVNNNALADVPESMPSTPLNLAHGQVRTLTVGGQLQRFAVGDENICQIIRAGDNQLKLIGTGKGETRLAVWANVVPQTAPVVRVFQLNVDQTLTATGQIVGDTSDDLNDSIRRVFPDAEARVNQRGDRLIVSGRCANEDIARDILRMVRKSCLVPVEDHLVVR